MTGVPSPQRTGVLSAYPVLSVGPAELPAAASPHRQGARVLSRHLPRLPASSSWLPQEPPRPATATNSNLKHSQATSKEAALSRGPAKLSTWLLAAELPSQGPQGWPGAASSVWFSPSRPGASDARLAVEAPVAWERHQGPSHSGWGDPHAGQTRSSLALPHVCPHRARPRNLVSLCAPLPPNRLPLWPQNGFFQTPIPGWDPALCRRTCAQRDRPAPSGPRASRATRDQPGYTRPHACAHISPAGSPEQPPNLGPVSWKSGPTSPAGWLSINHLHDNENGFGETPRPGGATQSWAQGRARIPSDRTR